MWLPTVLGLVLMVSASHVRSQAASSSDLMQRHAADDEEEEHGYELNTAPAAAPASDEEAEGDAVMVLSLVATTIIREVHEDQWFGQRLRCQGQICI